MEEQRMTLGEILVSDVDFDMSEIRPVLDTLCHIDNASLFTDPLFRRRVLRASDTLSEYIGWVIARSYQAIPGDEKLLLTLENNYEVLSLFPTSSYEEDAFSKECETCHVASILTPVSFPLTRSITQPGSYYYANTCRSCKNQKGMEAFFKKFAKDPQKVRDRQNQYANDHREEKRAYHKKWMAENKERIRTKVNEQLRARRASDAKHAILMDVSAEISRLLRERGSSKNGRSSRKALPWTKEQLFERIEWWFKQPGNEWMHWGNRGVYDPKIRKEDDKATWTWNLDHIIPKSEFHFTSMDSNEFRACWALDNLRPLESKQNVIDGSSRVRHTKRGKKSDD